VGHEPYLSGLIALLVFQVIRGAAVVMKKAGLCKLTVESLKHGRCAQFGMAAHGRVRWELMA